MLGGRQRHRLVLWGHVASYAAITLVWLIVQSACSPKRAAGDPDQAVADSVASAVVSGAFDRAVKSFSPELSAALPRQRLAAVWAGLVSKEGQFVKLGSDRPSVERGFKVVYVPMEFRNGTVDLRLVVSEGKVAGLFVAPAR